MTFSISRRRQPLTPDLTNLIREKLSNKSMSAIARELNLSVHTIKRVRDMQKETQQVSARRKLRDRREAELYVLSKLGKCTDNFAEFEKYVHKLLTPVEYGRDMSKPLAKIRIVISPSESN